MTAAQTATVKVPKRITAKGATVVLKKAVVTNAGQKATSRLTWSPKKSAKGTRKKYATVRTNRSGKVTITTTGKARKLYVKLRLKAPATPGYTAYSYTTAWTVKEAEVAGPRSPVTGACGLVGRSAPGVDSVVRGVVVAMSNRKRLKTRRSAAVVLVPGVSLGLGLGVLTCVQVAADTTAVDLLTGANVHIDGAAAGDLSGFSVAGAGDVNGDGRADVIIGARAADNNSRTESGSSYVVFGQPSLTGVDLNALGAAGFRIDGAATGDRSGSSVAGAGDVNGDGRADVIVGAPDAGNNSRNFLGFELCGVRQDRHHHRGPRALGTGGFRIDGAATDDLSGSSVAGAGDVNGDGRADLIIGAPDADNNSRTASGSSYVVFGRTGTTTVDLTALGTAGFRIDGAATGDGSGWSVAGAGDINGDGRADLIIGAPEADNNSRTSSGSSYVVFGRTATTTVDLSALGTAGFRIDGAATGDLSGRSVAGAGDINGDGRADLIIGAHCADNNSRTASGSSYVVFGRTDTTTVDLNALGTAGFRIDGAATSDASGRSVAGAGDVNGDGRAD